MLRLFCKTWKNDFPWLKLAMKSVAKLSTDPVHWTIVGDRGTKDEIELVCNQAMQQSYIPFRWDIHEIQEHWPEVNGLNGYYAQQWVKMNAYKVMGNDYFLNWDSDVIAVKKFNYNTFLGKSGRPIFWLSQFNHLLQTSDSGVHRARMEMMKDVMKFDQVSFEYMRCMPIPMNGQILRCGSQRQEWSNALNAIQNTRGGFSEFNIIGMFSHLYFPDAYEWRNADTQGPAWAGGWDQNGNCFQAHAYISQRYSWGGVERHIEDFVNRL